MTEITRRAFIRTGAAFTAVAGVRSTSRAQTGAPAGSSAAYGTPKPMIDGPFQPTWESLRDNYSVPQWFHEAKFGIFIHWGLYSIPARINEWYIRHMYTTDVQWHTEHYGLPDKFGYKDFIPLFTASRYEPAAWAELFKKAGAHYVVPVAEHHDGFAMWNSDITPWCAGKMGPKRDLIGELARAVRDHGLIFGVSSHRMEHHDFAYPAPGVPNDEFDPRYAGFYGPPVPGNMNDGNASPAFQMDWLARVQELIDKYEPQMIYFDNGVNPREYDQVKLKAAAYYYNRALQWRKQATLATKDVAYIFGSVQDFEKMQRAPKWIYPAAGWQCDDALGSTWGYTEGMHVRSAESIVRELVELASMGGNLLLNVSPKGDGSIPEEQERVLLAVGQWLATNGEGIYGSRAWPAMGEGPSAPDEAPGDWKGGSTAQPGPPLHPAPVKAMTEHDFRFTAGRESLYVFGFKQATGPSQIRSLRTGAAEVTKVQLLGRSEPLRFQQTEQALEVELPMIPQSTFPFTLKIHGTVPL